MNKNKIRITPQAFDSGNQSLIKRSPITSIKYDNNKESFNMTTIVSHQYDNINQSLIWQQ